jgi:hypothetical protein
VVQTPSSETAAGDVALLVDWENLKFSLLQRERRPSVTALRIAAERFGRIVYARAYADWQSPVHQGDPANLYMAGLEPVYVLTKQYTNDRGEVHIKNSVDVKLAADCVEASHQFPNIGTYIIVSGDHGFLHVVNTLCPHGKRVVIIGVSWTTAAQLTEQADVVLYYDIDVERVREEGAIAPPLQDAAAATKKLSPQMAQMAEGAVLRLKQENGNQSVDQRKVAEMLDAVLTVARQYRKDGRELSVSLVGQELQKRMNAADFQQHARGRSRPLVQALAAAGQIKLVSRGFVDWIYLPEEPDELIALETPPLPPEQPKYSFASLVFNDLTHDVRERVIVAIHDERHRPGTDWLTFRRILGAVTPIVGRDDYSIRNLVNNMVDIGILKADPERHSRDPDTGTTYSFKTFALDLHHPDVRRALHLTV